MTAPTTPATLVARLDRGGTVHEILFEDGEYSLSTSWRADQTDKPLSRGEAMQWIDDVIRPYGGEVFEGARHG